MSPRGPKKPTIELPPRDDDGHATWSPEDGLLVPPGSGFDLDLDTDPPTEEADTLPPESRARAPKGPAITAVPLTDDDPSSEDVPLLRPQTSERYEILDLLGRGGMGTVWRVRDTRLRRHLAMKVIHGAVVSADALTRFAQEAQITGQLEHPTIVPVHDLGRTPDGAVFYTMKEVRGEALLHILSRRWSAIDEGTESYDVFLVELIGVMVRVCEAVAFAHARGVIHRDLKPDNVMVGEFGEVQVMDWGLARLLGRSLRNEPDEPGEPVVTSDRADSNPLRTRDGSVAGTPSYMAPEQARGQADSMGPHSDIWALGAMLYEIVCGERAFDGATEDVLRRVKAGDVVPPSERVTRTISRELESVVLRAMQLDPGRRYPSADALRADLQAWLNGRPLATVRYSVRELMVKWARRHRSVLTAVGATALVALTLLGWGLFRYLQDLNAALGVAETEAVRAREAEAEARIRLAEGQVATADALAAAGRFVEARGLYREASEGLGAHGRRTISAELGLWSTYHEARGPIRGLEGTLLGLDAAGDRALVKRDGELVEVGLPLGGTRIVWPAPAGDVEHAVSDAAGWQVYLRRDGALYATRAEGGEPQRLLPLAPDQRILVVPSGERILVFAIDGGASVWSRGEAGFTAQVLSDTLGVMAANDDHAVLSRYARPTELWDIRAGVMLRQVSPVYSRAEIAPGGRTLVVHTEPDERLRAEDLLTGEVRWDIPADYLNPRAFTPDGRVLLAAGLEPGMVGIDMANGQVLFRMDGDPDAMRQVWATEDLVLSESQRNLVWALPDADAPLGQLVRMDGDLTEVDADLTGGLLVGVGTRGLRLWDLGSGVELPGWPLDGNPRDVALDQGGWRALVTLEDRDAALLVDLVTGEQRPFPARDQMSGTFLGDDIVALGGTDGSVRVVSLGDGATRWVHPAEEGAARWDIAFDAERGLLVAPAFHHARLDVFDAETGAVRRTLPTGHSAYTVRIHADTGRIATGSATRQGLVFGPDGTRLSALSPHDGPVLGQAFSPDGTLLATADFAGPLRIFDLSDHGRLLRTDRVQTGPLVRIWWTDPRRLLTVSGDSVLLRDLDVPARLAAGEALVGEVSESDLDLADLLSLHGLHDRAAALRRAGGAAPLDQARSWWLAGDVDQARRAMADATGLDPVHAGWRRLLAPGSLADPAPRAAPTP